MDNKSNDNEIERDEQQRRKLQKYIFDLEEVQEKAEELSAAHRKLRHSQELLLSVLSGTIHGICLVKDRRFVWCNEALEDILGWKQEELIGKTTEAIYQGQEAFERAGKVAYSGSHRAGLIIFEYDYLHKDGHRVPCLITGRAVDKNDLSQGHIFSFTDFTERKRARKALNNANEELAQRNADLVAANKELRLEIGERKRAEEALRSSENRFKTLFESAPDAYYLNDLKGNFIDGNKAAEKLIGYKRKELIGKNLFELNLLPLDQLPKVAELLGDNFEGKVTGPNELISNKKDGGILILEIRTIPIKLKDQDVILGIARDVTERKRLEERLIHAQKMEAVGVLASGVAHDLNNVLSAIVGYPELLLMEIPKDSPSRELIMAIDTSGKKAAAIVQDLLTLARRGVAVSEVVNLNKVISEYLKSPEHESLMSWHPGVRVETDLEADLRNIAGSPVHLAKAIMNLISNAVEAMPKGGVILVTSENRRLDGPVRGYDDVKEGNYAVLVVSDTGTGMSQNDMKRIFDPFYTKKQMGKSGSGLGMTVVWGTVKDHNGYIDIQSTEGKGTAFTLYFPVTAEVLPRDKTTLNVEAYAGDGESILFVDDMEEQRKIVTSMLTKLGYSVILASSGEKAVEYLKTNEIDLLVLDMIMDPGMDGLDTYMKILEQHPGQRAIISSGFSVSKRVRAALRLGAGQYIRKPYTLEELGIAVKNELGK